MQLAALVVLALAFTSIPPEPSRSIVVTRTDLPTGLSVSTGSSVAYAVTGPAQARYQVVRFPLAPLLKRPIADGTDYVLLAYSNGQFWPIPAQRDAGDLVAQVTPGLVYVVAEGVAEPMRSALAVLCRFSRPELRPEQRKLLPRICTQILCAPEPFYGPALATEYSDWRIGPGTLPPVLGGWRRAPGSVCSECTAGLGVVDLPPPTIECVSAVDPGNCRRGVPLLHDDFEADTAGAAPGSSPPGPPPDDAIASAGMVRVLSPGPWGTNAARIERTTAPTLLDAVLGAGAAPSGSYCLSFRGFTEEGRTGVGVSLQSADGKLAWRLAISDASTHLVGGVVQVIPTLATGPHQLRFEMDLDLGRFNLSVDGVLVAAGVPFLDADCGAPARLRFEYPAMILEGFPGAYMVDEIVVQKTN